MSSNDDDRLERNPAAEPVVPFGLPSMVEVDARKREIQRCCLEAARAFTWPGPERTPDWLTVLQVARPCTQHTSVAIRLAKDVEACAALLRGEPVDPARIDPGELFTARRKRLVQLVAPVDLIENVS